MNPMAWLDRKVMNPLTQRTLRDEERIVRTGSYPAWKLLVLLGAAVGALLVVMRWPDSWAANLALPFLGGYLAVASMSGVRRAQAYRNGWIAGRRDYDQQLGSWLDREDWTAGEFRMAQLMRTYQVLGSRPPGLGDDNGR